MEEQSVWICIEEPLLLLGRRSWRLRPESGSGSELDELNRIEVSN